MEILNPLIDDALTFIPVLATLAFVGVGLALINWFLTRRWKDNPDAQFRFQFIMLGLTFAGLLAVIVALPISDTLRGQLLSLIGILLSAAIALSSTTFIGNIMAGIMLKIIKSVRPGDFVTVADIMGRVTEMDLLHTEVQTEDRNLVTLPNLYVVTQPMKVVRSSGTLVSADVSLGYDLENSRVCDLLLEASENAGLTEGFVQVRELGDFSVSYRISGLLEEVKNLISVRSKLRVAVLDSLHGAGIEIVSPTFMNQRPLKDGITFIPEARQARAEAEEGLPEMVAFDKAENAASVEEIRKSIEKVKDKMDALKKEEGDDNEEEREALEAQKEELIATLKDAEERRKAADDADHAGEKIEEAKE